MQLLSGIFNKFCQKARRSAFGLISWVISCQALFGQDSIPDEKLVFIKDNVTLAVENHLFKPRDLPLNDEANMDIKPSYGFQVRFLYTLNFGRHFGLETGLFAGGHLIEMRSNAVNLPDFPVNHWTDQYLAAHFEIPLRPFFRLQLSSKNFAGLYTGVKMTRMPQQQRGFGTSGVNTNAFLDMQYTLSPDYAFYAFFHSGLFWQRLLPNCDMFRVALEYNWNFDNSSVLYGTYRYFNDQRSLFGSGKLDWRGNYLGLEVGYTFGRVRELRRDLARAGLN